MVEYLAPLGTVEGMEPLQTHEPDVVLAGVHDGPLTRFQLGDLVDPRRVGLGRSRFLSFLLTLCASHDIRFVNLSGELSKTIH